MGRTAALRAGPLAEPCNPPTAAKGCYGLTPQDLHSAYALPATGPTEQTIALVDAYDDPSAEADLKVFDEEFHLPACTSANGCFTKVNENGKAGPLSEPQGEWAIEISLDIQVAHAICQNCHILLVEASDETSSSLYAAAETAARMGATEISNSWESEEPLTDSAVFNHPGVVVTAASGDSGYLNWGSSEPAAIGHVGYPASSPHVVAVGGTRLQITSEHAWAGESVWNDGSGATGGGCSEGFEAPPWQRELPNWSAVGCGTKRAVADVSADADPYTGIAVYDSTTMVQQPGGGSGPLGWETFGGTSLAAPLIAATFALAGGAGEVEYPAKTLYEAERLHPESLHDVESGSNGRCLNSPNPKTGQSGCTTLEEAADCNSEAICVAGPGYDGPSGVGTPDGLAAFKPPSKPIKRTQTIEFTSRAPSSAVVGGTYTPAAVASSGLPVSLTSGTPQVCSLAGSTVSFIAAGTCTIDSNQAGDASYQAAPEVQQSFVVSKSSQRITFTSNAPPSAAVGGPPYVVSAIASSGLPVSFSSATPSVCALEGASVSFVGAGTCTVRANQPGNSNYEAAPEAQQTFAVGRRAQVVEFSSTPPASATVGGPSYAVAARASSGLPVSLSSGTPSVCTLAGSTVGFLEAGTCTIDANQPGNSNFEPAPETRQSFAVGGPPALMPMTTPGATPAGSPPPELASLFTPPLASPLTPPLASPSTPPPDSDFSLQGNPTVNTKTGAITFIASVSNPGTFTWLVTFRNGTFGAFSATRSKCSASRIRLNGKCRPAQIVFGKSALSVGAAAGARVTVTFTATPSSSARKALANALARGRALPVTALLSFRSSLGGGSVSHSYSITARLAKATKAGSQPNGKRP
jgi:hypothetical protein